jgi:BspA type Leucine rich repeat region (6 copies)
MPAGDIFITTDGHTYKVLDDNASVTLWYLAGGGTGIVNIPQTVQDSNNVTYTVIHAGDICNNRYITAQNASTLTDIILPPSVTKIGRYAFRSCRSLISVIAPNVTELYSTAFAGCQHLTSVEIPSLSVAGFGAFANCYALTYVSFPAIMDIEETAFNSCTGLRGLYVGNRAQTDINISGENVFFNVGPLDISFSFFYSTVSSWPESFVSGGVTIPCIFYSPTVNLTSSPVTPIIGSPLVLTIASTDTSLLRQYKFIKDNDTLLLTSTLDTYTITSYSPATNNGYYEAELIDNFSNVYRTNSLLLSIFRRPCDDDRGKPNLYGADHESVRVRKRIDACKCCHGGYAGPAPTVVQRCTECDIVTSSQPRATQALSEHQRMMREIIACPMYEKTYTIDIVCEDVTDAAKPSETVPPYVALLNSQNPYIRYEYRTYDRISGIEEIADTVRGISSSEITARRRRIQEVSSAESRQRRHAEHFRATPPPPPCRVPRTGPQPGVPIAPVTPCNPGTQRVDYSIPQY